VKHLGRIISGLLSPGLQVRLAWGQLGVSIVGWPLSLLFVAEPPVILSLSWWAVLATALNYIASAQANKAVSDEEGKD